MTVARVMAESNSIGVYGSPEARKIIKSIRNANNSELVKHDFSLKDKISKIIGKNKNRPSKLIVDKTSISDAKNQGNINFYKQ